MKRLPHCPISRLRLIARALSIAIPMVSLVVGARTFEYSDRPQEIIPAQPANHALIYFANAANALEPLPFESGTTPLKTDVVAANDKTSYIEVNGPGAEKTIENPLARFYLFVTDEANVHPPLIVLLTSKRGTRRVTTVAQRGLKGYAIFSEEIVKPRYRVLSRTDGVIYLEISPRESLAPGEYAIIGTDLQRIATFRIATASSR